MKRAVCVLCVLILSGCLSYGTRTYYTPAVQSDWSAGETGVPTLEHKWASGAKLVVCLRTIGSKADLLFQLDAPEGATISSADLTARLEVTGHPDEILAVQDLRRSDFRLLGDGDYEVVFQNLDRLDGSKGTTLRRPKAWRFKKLDSMFEWRVVAKLGGEKKITLRLPTLTIDGVGFTPRLASFELATGRVVTGYPAW